MLGFILSFLGNRRNVFGSIFSFALIAFGLYMFFQVRSCEKDRKNEAIIKHNTEKLEKVKKQAIERVETFTEQEKSELQEIKQNAKTFKQVLKDKNCINEAMQKCENPDSKACKRRTMLACYENRPKLSIEEIREKTNRAFRKLEQGVAK